MTGDQVQCPLCKTQLRLRGEVALFRIVDCHRCFSNFQVSSIRPLILTFVPLADLDTDELVDPRERDAI